MRCWWLLRVSRQSHGTVGMWNGGWRLENRQKARAEGEGGVGCKLAGGWWLHKYMTGGDSDSPSLPSPGARSGPDATSGMCGICLGPWGIPLGNNRLG
jgi:hypothetical protein